MARSQVNPPFLASCVAPKGDIVLVGAPLDLTETFRAGTALGPRRVRYVSDSLETYSPILDRDLEDVVLIDWGDIALDGLAMPEALAAIETEVGAAVGAGIPIILGGEHTLTLGAVRAVHQRYPDVAVVQVDAHLDLIEEYAGLRVSHATVMRRVAEIVGWSSLVQVGVRSGTRAEYAAAGQCLYSSSGLALPPYVADQLGTRPVYLSLDVDVLDPAYAPGTGCPEPGGPSFRELLEFLYSLLSLRVVAVDIVEVTPDLDHSDITALAAAKLVRESALLFRGV